MAKKATKTIKRATPAEQRALVPASSKSNLPANRYDHFAGMATGLENVRPEDLVIPRLKLLQKESPQCLRTKPEYIEGAEAGMFMDTSTQELFEQLELLCCHFQIRYLEWNGRKQEGGNGEGMIMDHGEDPACIKGLEKKDYKFWTNEAKGKVSYIVDTRTFFALNIVGGQPRGCMFSLTGSQSTPARTWITAMRNYRVQHSDGHWFTPPAFARSYIVTTRDMHNDDGEWKVWNILPGRDIFDFDNSQAILNEATALYELASGGQLSFTEEQPEDDAAAEGEQQQPRGRRAPRDRSM